MSESVFRTASPAPAPVSTESAKGVDSPGVAPDTHESSLFATYEDDQGNPYAADYFEIKGIWKDEPTLANELKTIEGYIREKVSNKEIENNTKSAKKFIQELEKKAGTNVYENTNKRIQKLLAYIEFRKVVES